VQPTQILSNEHRVIEVVLGCLEKITEEAQSAGKLDRDSAEQAVDFIRNFADKCHHGKEEVHLFTAMVAKGVPQEGGPVGVMLYEHDLGRNFVAGMAKSIPLAAEGDAAALGEFARHASGYVQLLRNHIQKEDNILFPMADRVLTEADQKQLMASFETVEKDHMGAGTHEKYVAIADSLAERFGVRKAAGVHLHSCCGH
jgi:hemerythrin-like domain-containing protein